MNSLNIATAYLKHKTANTILTVLTFAIGVAIILSLVTLNNELENEFNKNFEEYKESFAINLKEII